MKKSRTPEKPETLRKHISITWRSRETCFRPLAPDSKGPVGTEDVEWEEGRGWTSSSREGQLSRYRCGLNVVGGVRPPHQGRGRVSRYRNGLNVLGGVRPPHQGRGRVSRYRYGVNGVTRVRQDLPSFDAYTDKGRNPTLVDLPSLMSLGSPTSPTFRSKCTGQTGLWSGDGLNTRSSVCLVKVSSP